MIARNVLGADTVMVDVVGVRCFGAMVSSILALDLPRVPPISSSREVPSSVGVLVMPMTDDVWTIAKSRCLTSLLHWSRLRGLSLWAPGIA